MSSAESFDEQDSDSSIASQEAEPESKKRRSLGGGTCWKDSYAEKYPKIIMSKKGKQYFHCQLCKMDVTFGKKGEAALRKHTDSAKHKEKFRLTNANSTVDAFVTKKPKPKLDDKTMACELAFAYHLVSHNHSQDSAQCTSKLIPEVFCDSAIAGQYGSSYTKTSALVKGVMHPHFKQRFLDEVRKGDGYYSAHRA